MSLKEIYVIYLARKKKNGIAYSIAVKLIAYPISCEINKASNNNSIQF